MFGAARRSSAVLLFCAKASENLFNYSNEIFTATEVWWHEFHKINTLEARDVINISCVGSKALAPPFSLSWLAFSDLAPTISFVMH